VQETDPLLTISEAADRLGTSHKNLRNWAKSGHAAVVAVGPTKRLRISEREVERLAALMKPRPVAS